MKASWIIPVLLLGGLSFAEGPWVLNWDGLLGSVTNDPKYKAATDRVGLIKEAPGLGLWDKMELRYELDGFDFREHKVNLRVSPYGFGEVSSFKHRQTARRMKNEADRDQVLGETLYDRYVLGVEWIYRKHQLAYHESLKKIYEDLVQVHTTLSGTALFDPRELVESQQDLVEVQGRILSDQNDIVEIEQVLGVLVPGWASVDLDTNDLLSTQTLRERLDKFSVKVDSTHPEYKVLLGDLRKAEADYKLEKSISRRFVSYADVGYAWQIPKSGKTDKTTPIEDLNFGVGIRIPFGDGRAQEEYELQIDIGDVKSELLEKEWSISKDVNKKKREIGALIRQIAVQDSFVARVDAGALFTDYAMRAGSDPLLLLKARSSALQTSWNCEQLKYEAYLLYLEMLQMTGVLSRDPGTNHLKGKG